MVRYIKILQFSTTLLSSKTKTSIGNFKVLYHFKGSQCSVLIEWENGETAYELLIVIGTDDPVTCVIYIHENDLLKKPGWKHPRTYEQALDPDKRNRNTLRGDATTLELTQIDDYDSFINKGHNKVKTPNGFKKTPDQIAQYQSTIDTLPWIVTIGRFDINTAATTMSGFHIAPRVGHLSRIKCIYGYLLKMKHAPIRIRTEEPDYSDIPDNIPEWTYSVRAR
jgi:hypothetical protein